MINDQASSKNIWPYRSIPFLPWSPVLELWKRGCALASDPPCLAGCQPGGLHVSKTPDWFEAKQQSWTQQRNAIIATPGFKMLNLSKASVCSCPFWIFLTFLCDSVEPESPNDAILVRRVLCAVRSQVHHQGSGHSNEILCNSSKQKPVSNVSQQCLSLPYCHFNFTSGSSVHIRIGGISNWCPVGKGKVVLITCNSCVSKCFAKASWRMQGFWNSLGFAPQNLKDYLQSRQAEMLAWQTPPQPHNGVHHDL